MKTDKKIIMIPDFFILLRTIDMYPNKSATDMQIMTVITYSHLHKLKKILHNMGLIEIIKDGVRTLLKTTPKGKNVVSKINELLISLDIDESDLLKYRQNTKHKYNIENKEQTAKKIIKDATKIIEEEEDDEISMTPEEFMEIKNGRQN